MTNSKRHSRDLEGQKRLTEDVYRLLVTEKRRRKQLEEQLEATERALDNGDSLLSQAGRENERLQEQLEVADTFARVADAYCWDSETTTHADLMNARAAWQSAVGRMRLRALDSNPASRGDDSSPKPKEEA